MPIPPQSQQPSKPSELILRCPHCEMDQSSRGKPFTQISLQHHIRKRHPAGINQETKPDHALSCEICGCWKSRRGIPFTTRGHLSRHRSAMHGKLSPSADHLTDDKPTHTGKLKSKENRPQVTSASVKFCPQCGCNVEVIAAALSFFS
jgi:hypothetical protein